METMKDPIQTTAFKPKKVFWKEKGSQPYAFLCPHCGSQRRIAYQPNPTPRHYMQIALTAACLTLLCWPLFGWKGIVSFIPIWTFFEVLYRGRVRGALYCSNCGFDPLLYMTDVKRARLEIETHWRKKFEEKGIPFPEKPKDLRPAAPPSSGTLLASNVSNKLSH